MRPHHYALVAVSGVVAIVVAWFLFGWLTALIGVVIKLAFIVVVVGAVFYLIRRLIGKGA